MLKGEICQEELIKTAQENFLESENNGESTDTIS